MRDELATDLEAFKAKQIKFDAEAAQMAIKADALMAKLAAQKEGKPGANYGQHSPKVHAGQHNLEETLRQKTQLLQQRAMDQPLLQEQLDALLKAFPEKLPGVPHSQPRGGHAEHGDDDLEMLLDAGKNLLDDPAADAELCARKRQQVEEAAPEGQAQDRKGGRSRSPTTSRKQQKQQLPPAVDSMVQTAGLPADAGVQHSVPQASSPPAAATAQADPASSSG